jgi:hypothetical protein
VRVALVEHNHLASAAATTAGGADGHAQLRGQRLAILELAGQRRLGLQHAERKVELVEDEKLLDQVEHQLIVLRLQRPLHLIVALHRRQLRRLAAVDNVVDFRAYLRAQPVVHAIVVKFRRHRPFNLVHVNVHRRWVECGVFL